MANNKKMLTCQTCGEKRDFVLGNRGARVCRLCLMNEIDGAIADLNQQLRHVESKVKKLSNFDEESEKLIF